MRGDGGARAARRGSPDPRSRPDRGWLPATTVLLTVGLALATATALVLRGGLAVVVLAVVLAETAAWSCSRWC